jgi:hypothetical protein
VGQDVLVEAQLAAWVDDAVELGEREGLIGNGAEHERGDPGIEDPASPGKRSALSSGTEIGTGALVAARCARSRR